MQTTDASIRFGCALRQTFAPSVVEELLNRAQKAEGKVRELEAEDAAVGRLFHETAERETALLERVADLEVELNKWKQSKSCGSCRFYTHPGWSQHCSECGKLNNWEPVGGEA